MCSAARKQSCLVRWSRIGVSWNKFFDGQETLGVRIFGHCSRSVLSGQDIPTSRIRWWTSWSILSHFSAVLVWLHTSYTRARNLLTRAASIYHGGRSRRDTRFMLALTVSHRNVVISYVVWLTATRTAKLLPHLWYRPQDIIHIPAFILFGYYFAIMKIYALLTCMNCVNCKVALKN